MANWTSGFSSRYITTSKIAPANQWWAWVLRLALPSAGYPYTLIHNSLFSGVMAIISLPGAFDAVLATLRILKSMLHRCLMSADCTLPSQYHACDDSLNGLHEVLMFGITVPVGCTLGEQLLAARLRLTFLILPHLIHSPHSRRIEPLFASSVHPENATWRRVRFAMLVKQSSQTLPGCWFSDCRIA